jgi:hypothetical protein
MYPTMMSSISPPITGGPAQDLGGAKQDPKACRDTTIIIDPNTNLENHLVQLIFASGAFGLCQKPSNTTRSEPAYWIYYSQRKLIEKFENFKTNNHPI